MFSNLSHLSVCHNLKSKSITQFSDYMCIYMFACTQFILFCKKKYQFSHPLPKLDN